MEQTDLRGRKENLASMLLSRARKEIQVLESLATQDLLEIKATRA